MALAACSSNGSTGTPAPTPTPTPTPAPTPTPTPTPAPTPTPTASYTKFDALTGDQHFLTACTALNTSGALPVAGTATQFGKGLDVIYTSSTDVYTVSGDGISLSFMGKELQTAVGGDKIWQPLVGNDLVTFETPHLGTTAFDYVRMSYVDTTKAGATFVYPCILGVPTLTFDIPSTGSLAYQPNNYTAGKGIDGFAYQPNSGAFTTYSLANATATFQVDFAKRKIQTSMHLDARSSPVPPTTPKVDFDFGTVTGTADIDPVTGTFYGTWSSTGRDVTGTFGGAFFGPQAKEFGFTFSISGKDAGGTPIFVSSGVLTGMR